MLTVDDAEALRIINIAFGHSEPGAQIHQLVLLCPGRHPVLGTPQLVTELCAIAPTYDNANTNARFTRQAIISAVAKQQQQPVLAVLTMEVFDVCLPPGTDEVAKNQARVLHARGRLGEHQAATEVTMLYAAAADGRRWTGTHHLTGPRAGEQDGPTSQLRGTRSREDDGPMARMIRAAVGLSW